MSGIHLPWAGARQEGQQEGYRQEHRTLGIHFYFSLPKQYYRQEGQEKGYRQEHRTVGIHC